MSGHGGSASELELARVLLARLGITPDQLLGSPTSASAEVPTFDEYIERVSQAVTAGTRRVYESYWSRISGIWGGRRLNEPTPLEIKQLAERVKGETVVRRNSRGGRSAAEHLISAFRCLYRHAVDDGYIAERDNPAARVAKPRRLANTRRALLDTQLAEINRVVESTGDDPELDTLIVRFHEETAARRGGALRLRPFDLDREQCLVRLREKGETERWQPVSPTMMYRLCYHGEERSDGDPYSQLLRYRNRKPITTRRYDYIWSRLGLHLPWVAVQQVSTHWIRYTTLTYVERNFGYAVARAYAGHNGRKDNGTTATYVRADLYEVALALAALTGEAHPLVPAHSSDLDRRSAEGGHGLALSYTPTGNW